MLVKRVFSKKRTWLIGSNLSGIVKNIYSRIRLGKVDLKEENVTSDDLQGIQSNNASIRVATPAYLLLGRRPMEDVYEVCARAQRGLTSSITIMSSSRHPSPTCSNPRRRLTNARPARPVVTRHQRTRRTLSGSKLKSKIPVVSDKIVFQIFEDLFFSCCNARALLVV